MKDLEGADTVEEVRCYGIDSFVGGAADDCSGFDVRVLVNIRRIYEL